MKNLLGKKEFLNIKLITEAEGGGMDFSNRTGWSQSLIGRAVNKLFSWGKSIKETQVLKSLKQKLENEYLKGILRAMAQRKITKKDIEKPDLMVDVFLILKSEIKKIDSDPNYFNMISDENIQEVNEYGKKTFYFEVKRGLNLNDWEFYVLAAYDSVTEMMPSADRLSVELNKKVKFIIKDKNKPEYKEEYYILITEEKEEISETDTTDSSSSDSSTSDSSTSDSSTSDSSTSFSGSTNVQQQNALDAHKEPKSLPAHKLSSLPEHILSKDEMEAQGNKIIKDLENKKIDPNQLEKIKKILRSCLNNPEEKEMNSAWNIFKDKTSKLMTVENINTGYGKFIYESCMNEINLLYDNIIFEENIVTNTSKKVKVYFSNKIKSKRNKKQSIKDILDDAKLTENDKELNKSYGSLNFSEMNADGIAKKFIDDVELRKLSTKLVNKEALKEIALKAEWMYNDEKYKDKRSDVYSRVNWTTTGPDMMKLKNKWEKIIKSVTSQYTPFFSDENGNFPKQLDPIALINSDKKFREEFDQYRPDDQLIANSKVGIIPGQRGNTQTLPKSLIQYGMIKVGTTEDKDYGLWAVTTKTGRSIGILFQKFSYGRYKIYKFVGFLDFGKIMNEVKDKDSKDKVKKIISKYHYTSKGVDKITTTLPAEDEELKSIYYAFRGNKQDPKLSKDSMFTTYFRATDINKGGQNDVHPYQIIFVSDDTNWNKNNISYISEIGSDTKGNPKINKYIEVKDVVDNTNKSKYQFAFVVSCAYNIRTDAVGDIWGITKRKDDDDRSNLLSDPNIIENIIAKLDKLT